MGLAASTHRAQARSYKGGARGPAVNQTGSSQPQRSWVLPLNRPK